MSPCYAARRNPPVSCSATPKAGSLQNTRRRSEGERSIALKEHRDAGFPDLPAPRPALVKEMVDFITGIELDDAYGDFLMSELKIFDEGSVSRVPGRPAERRPGATSTSS